MKKEEAATCKQSKQQKQQQKQKTKNKEDVMKVLEVLKEASQMLQNKPSSKDSDSDSNISSRSSSSSSPSSSPVIRALLELETESELFSNDPNLSTLSHHLTRLKSLLCDRPHRSFFLRRASDYQISSVAGSIEAQIQAWIDRESIHRLVLSLSSQEDADDDEDRKVGLLEAFEGRVSEGFDRDLQDTVLKSKVFEALEAALCDPTASTKRVRERAAAAILALVRFNKDVFVGQVLMGRTVRALVAMATASSIRVLCGIVRSIKSPLVDDIQSNGEIPRIVGLLGSEDFEIRVAGMDLVMEIGYFGRKEAIEALLEDDLVKKLVELQRSEGGGSLIEMGGRFDAEEEEEEEDDDDVGGIRVERTGKKKSKERSWLERHPFASCVARFAIQLEVGEGLRQREKRAFKQEVLKRVRETALSEADAATILAEVLWGSSP